MLVIITGFYAWVTFKILIANKQVVQVMHEQAEAMTRPYVIATVFLEIDNPIFYLRIANTGKTSAQKLKLTLDKSFERIGNKPAFNEVIQSFPPGAELIFMLAHASVVFNDNEKGNKLPSNFTVTAEYSFGAKTISEQNIIDMQPYFESDIPQNAYVRKLKAINESIIVVANKIEKYSIK